jgi:predicted transcriptional regulator
MARASRSSKKQPAFDPSELQDLIFSPAVGSGVGSHLLEATRDFPAPETTADVSTMDMSTVDTSQIATVDRFNRNQPHGLQSVASIFQDLPLVNKVASRDLSHLSTVVISRPSTVVISPTVAKSGQILQEEEIPENATKPSTVDRYNTTTIDTADTSTVIETGSIVKPTELESSNNLHEGREDTLSIKSTTVDTSNLSTVQAPEDQFKKPQRHTVLWITEQGDLVPQSRVKRIRLAQDAINSAEESVYDTLWTCKSVRSDDREPFRIVQAGYDYLVKRTRLSKKTIQRIVAKLIDKDFIAIERPADIYQRSSTVYRVFSYKTVLDRHLQRGRSHVAKMGPGFSYVRPIDDPRLHTIEGDLPPGRSNDAPINSDLSTVVNFRTPTVDNIARSTLANKTTETVAQTDLSTVVPETTIFIGKNVLGNNTSSSLGIHQALSQYGVVDDDIINRFLTACKQQTADCTEAEIIHFIHEKGTFVRVRDSRIYNPIGFLLTAVPKCLSGEAFRLYREEQRKQREAAAALEERRQAELDEWRREQEDRLVDPKVSEDDKNIIRQWLGVRT